MKSSPGTTPIVFGDRPPLILRAMKTSVVHTLLLTIARSDVEFSDAVFVEIVDGLLDLVGAFLDWLFESPCVEEEEAAEGCS